MCTCCSLLFALAARHRPIRLRRVWHQGARQDAHGYAGAAILHCGAAASLQHRRHQGWAHGAVSPQLGLEGLHASAVQCPDDSELPWCSTTAVSTVCWGHGQGAHQHRGGRHAREWHLRHACHCPSARAHDCCLPAHPHLHPPQQAAPETSVHTSILHCPRPRLQLSAHISKQSSTAGMCKAIAKNIGLLYNATSTGAIEFVDNPSQSRITHYPGHSSITVSARIPPQLPNPPPIQFTCTPAPCNARPHVAPIHPPTRHAGCPARVHAVRQ
jgi:hypothetical protein